MREIIEYRILEKYASLLFSDGEGQKTSIARRIRLDSDDPRCKEVQRLQKEIHAKNGDFFFYGWKITRLPSKAEIDDAKLFLLTIPAVFEPPGEDLGTIYDESFACPKCGAGARQRGDLFLNLRRAPKSKDIARTIADEIIISARVVECFERRGISGGTFSPVRLNQRSSAISNDWYQFSVGDAGVELESSTRFGDDPFDEAIDNRYECSLRDSVGLRLVSPVYVNVTSVGHVDLASSRLFVGLRQGVLRPKRLLFFSKKAHDVVCEEGYKGFEFEISYLV
jgi:hypothetical protein